MSTEEDREWDAHLDRIAEDQEAREDGEDWQESELTVWERNR